MAAGFRRRVDRRGWR